MCSTASSVLLLKFIGMGLVNFFYLCSTLAHAKTKSWTAMARRKFTLHIYLSSSEKTDGLCCLVFFSGDYNKKELARPAATWPSCIHPRHQIYATGWLQWQHERVAQTQAACEVQLLWGHVIWILESVLWSTSGSDWTTWWQRQAGETEWLSAGPACLAQPGSR